MKYILAFLGFAALSFGQVTRDNNGLTTTSSDDHSPHGPTTSPSAASSTVDGWPKYSAPTTSAAAVFTSSADGNAPFTFGTPEAPFSFSSTPSYTDTWGSWSAASSPATSASSWTTSAVAVPVTSAYSAGTTHATSYATTSRASSSTRASSAAQATYTGAASNGREVALGVGAIAAGLALVF